MSSQAAKESADLCDPRQGVLHPDCPRGAACCNPKMPLMTALLFFDVFSDGCAQFVQFEGFWRMRVHAGCETGLY